MAECVGSTQKHVGNALDMRCDDAISRQAVLDGIEELKKSPWATDKRGNGFEYLIAEALDVVADLCVKQAPPVNPQEPCDDAISEKEQKAYNKGYVDGLQMREFTEEEAEAYSKALDKMYKPTGLNVNDLIEPCDDAISRQAVIDEIRFGQSYITKISSTGEIENLFVNENRALEDAVDRVKELPSVTPKVIDDIKAEINEGIESYKNKDNAVMYGFMCALYIINKHIEGWDKE